MVNYIETEALNKNIKMIVVDFLQLQKSSLRHQSRHHEISYIITKYKYLAKELNIPLLYASQLDKEMQKRDDRRPRAGDLKESGDIFTHTDNILAIYSPEKILKETERLSTYAAEVFTLKGKDQEKFSTWLNFNGHFQEYTDGEKPEIVSKKNGRKF
jgi:replicative DNA helicase